MVNIDMTAVALREIKVKKFNYLDALRKSLTDSIT